MKKFYSSVWPLILALVFYFVGAVLVNQGDIDSLKEMGVVNQEEYTYTDSDGEEHEGETLMEVKGVGEVLTYKDIYSSSIPIFFAALILSSILFKGSNNGMQIKFIIFANCILGFLLIWLTTKQNIIPTILFWLGIISAASYKETNNEET